MKSARGRIWGVPGVIGLLLLAMLGSVLLAHLNAERRHRQYALNTALFQAVRKSAYSQVEALLAHGAEANALEHYAEPDAGLSTLWEPTWKRLCGLPVEENVEGGSGQSAFHAALHNAGRINFQDWSFIKLLAEHGANVNAEDGYTALSAALGDGHLQIAELLITRGADVNAESGDPMLRGRYTLLAAVMDQENDTASEFLIAHGAKVNCLDSARKTPLHWAAVRGNLPLAKRLIAKGADLQAQDALGQTALMLARKGNRPEMAAFLKQQGATELPASRNAQGQVVLPLPLVWRHGPVPPERLRFVIESSGNAQALTLYENERAATLPLDFTSLLGNARLWAPSELNTILYQIQRGYYSNNGYQFCGLVTLHHQTYLGIRWYSPPSSYREIFAVCVFRLNIQGSTLTLTRIRKGGGEWPGDHYANSQSKVPFLSTSARGELLMTETGGAFELGASDVWRKVGPCLPGR
ncbi:MAG: hypothetical protein JWN14_3720 [Chthonomonadales bacterium]|nr:hypothetical protein [Chthonomonadales bacterium]